MLVLTILDVLCEYRFSYMSSVSRVLQASDVPTDPPSSPFHAGLSFRSSATCTSISCCVWSAWHSISVCEWNVWLWSNVKEGPLNFWQNCLQDEKIETKLNAKVINILPHSSHRSVLKGRVREIIVADASTTKLIKGIVIGSSNDNWFCGYQYDCANFEGWAGFGGEQGLWEVM